MNFFYAAYEDARRIKTPRKNNAAKTPRLRTTRLTVKNEERRRPEAGATQTSACVESKKQMPKGTTSCAVCPIKTRKRLSERSAAQRETERAKRRERAAKASDARQHRCRSVFTAPVSNKWHKKCNTLLKNRDERFVEEAARKQKRGALAPLFVEKISLFCRLFCCNARTE